MKFPRAADTANLAIADNLAQVEALDFAERGGRRVSLDYAGSLLATAKAAQASARAERELALQRIPQPTITSALSMT